MLVSIAAFMEYAGTYIPSNCPGNTYGNNNSSVIKYFSSPFCVACWAQKDVIETFVLTHGDTVQLQEYDVDLCPDASKPHAIRGVPAFIANDTVVYGLQQHEQLEAMIA